MPKALTTPRAKIFFARRPRRGTYNNPIKGLKHHLLEPSHHQLRLSRSLISGTRNLEAVSRRRHHHSSSKLAREYTLYEKFVHVWLVYGPTTTKIDMGEKKES